jgi:hypothetical protein
MLTIALLLTLQGGFFFGDYYGTPSGCGWACTEGECTSLPSCNPDPEQSPALDWPRIRLEPQTGYGFSSPRIGFDYIVSGPFHLVIPHYSIDWVVQVFIGFEEANVVFPVEITGTVPVTLWVVPTIQPIMTNLYGEYTHTVSVPNDATLIGLTLYHQVTMSWLSPSGTLRVTASRGLKAVIEG